MSATHRPRAAAILALPLIVAVALTLFAWPASRQEPRDLPVGVAGPATATARIERALGGRTGAFEVRRFDDEAAAREAIQQREVYGAFVAGASGAKLLTASAASPAVAQALTHTVQARGGQAVPIEDVVPASPRTAGLAASVLPLVIAGILTGLVAALAAAGALRRTALLAAGSLLTGLAATAVVQGWLGIVGGDWVANAAALSLTVVAIGATVAGLEALLGRAGIAAAAITMVFVGNPFSAVGSAPELLPEPVGGLGQLLPPGAGGNLLRSTGYFDGAAAGGPVTVLALWAIAGLAALALAAVLERRPAHAAAGARTVAA